MTLAAPSYNFVIEQVSVEAAGGWYLIEEADIAWWLQKVLMLPFLVARGRFVEHLPYCDRPPTPILEIAPTHLQYSRQTGHQTLPRFMESKYENTILLDASHA